MMNAKPIIYIIVVLIVLLFLEAMEIVDIPYLEVPDFFSGKGTMMQKTTEGLEDL